MCREKAAREKQAQKKCVLLFLGIALAIGGITIIYIMERRHEAEMQAQEQKMGEEILQDALVYIDTKDYKSAFDLLNELPSDFTSKDLDRREISKLRTYLNVQITYDSNNLDVVQGALNQLEYIDGKDFSNISNSLSAEIDKFKKEVSEQCNYLMQLKYKGIVPYVGMSENALYSTEWGTPIEIITTENMTSVHKYYLYKVDKIVYLAYISSWKSSASITVDGVYAVYKKFNGQLGFIPRDSESVAILSDEYVFNQIINYIE